jgi:hypothetical protein
MIEYTVKVYDNGDVMWFMDDELHREDGPAVEHANGGKEWYLNGELHREDGPACEYYDGTKSWYLNGKHHREDGPAIEYFEIVVLTRRKINRRRTRRTNSTSKR